MEKISVDVEEVLSDCQCHFNWGLEEYEDSYSDPKLKVDEYIKRYNSLKPNKFIRRFRNSLFLSYIMYRDGLDGWDKLLENGFRIMENTRVPNYPQGLNTLPSYDSPLYTGSTLDFFAYVEDSTTTNVGNKEFDFDESDLEDRLKDEGESFIGLYVAAEHVFYSLKATILFRIGSLPVEILELLSHAVRMDDMTQGDRAALLFIKATTVRNCGDKGLDTAIDVLKTSVLTDPDNMRWPLFLIRYSGEKRRSKWGRVMDKSEIQSLVQVIDSVLQHDLEPWMRVLYQFDKLQALNEMGVSRKTGMSRQELASVFQICTELSEILVRSTEEPRILSYCAQFFSNNRREIQKAIQLVEKALEKNPGDVYVNAKASNIYKRGGQLEKALECAEKAATRGFGSWWQVFELKTALNHVIDCEEFFCNLIKNYPQDKHVKVTHKNAALYFVVQGDFKRALVHFKALLDMYDNDDVVYGESYCVFIYKKLHTVEAAYNVVLFVLSSNHEHDDSERKVNVDLCNAIRKMIEEKFDLDDFKYNGRVTPKQYVEWLRRKTVKGVRDYGPGTGNIESGRRLPYGDRYAEGKRSDNYQNRGTAGYQNRYSKNTEPSNYRGHSRGNRGADNRNIKRIGNWRDSRSGGTAFHGHPLKRSRSWGDHPSHHSNDRSSECSGRNASSAANMANYFGRLESLAKKIPVDSANTMTTRPRSSGTYPGINQQNDELLEKLSSKSDSTGETLQDAIPSTSNSSGINRNDGERDNCDTPKPFL